MYASIWKGTCTLLGVDANSICKEENATLFQDKVRMLCMTSKKNHLRIITCYMQIRRELKDHHKSQD